MPKYQKEISDLVSTTKAEAIVVIVIGGESGDCYEVRAQDKVFQALPKVLKELASKIEHDIEQNSSATSAIRQEAKQ